jgi:hypothetical protein
MLTAGVESRVRQAYLFKQRPQLVGDAGQLPLQSSSQPLFLQHANKKYSNPALNPNKINSNPFFIQTCSCTPAPLLRRSSSPLSNSFKRCPTSSLRLASASILLFDATRDSSLRSDITIVSHRCNTKT